MVRASKMKNSFAFLVLTLLMSLIQGAHINKGEDKKYCTDETDLEFKLGVGEQGASPKGSCMLVKCEDVVEGKPIFTKIGCGVFAATPGCKVTDYDKTKFYPDCCPNEIC